MDRHQGELQGQGDFSGQVDQSLQLAELLARLSWHRRRSGMKALAPTQVTMGQARILRHLAHCETPVRMRDVADRFEIAPRSVTAVIDGLEEVGFVERVPDPEDRRSIRLVVTPSGHQALLAMDHARAAAARAVFSALTPDEISQLIRLFERVLVHPGSNGGQCRA